MVSNRERHHGKMEYLGPIAQSHQTQIGHTSFKPRIRLEPTTTSLPLSCIELLVVLGVSILHKGPSYQSLILNLMENLHCLLLIGTRLISRFVCDILPPFLQYFVTQKKIFYISSLESYKYVVKTLYYFIQNGYSTVLLREGT